MTSRGSLAHMLRVALLGSSLTALAGCSFVNDAVWPSLVGAQPPEIEAETGANTGDKAAPAELPLFDAPTFNAGLAPVEQTLTAIESKMPDHRARQAALHTSLEDRAQKVASPEAIAGETVFDQWASAQIELSRLNAEIRALELLQADVAADSAEIAIGLSELSVLGNVADIPDPDYARLTAAGDKANRVLVGLGQLQAELNNTHSRWVNYAQAQSDRIGSQQVGTIHDETAQTPATKQPPAPKREGWPDSGDRFMGRKPLMSVSFADPDIAYRDEMRDLMNRVKTQYPDIAFEIEVIGADPAEVRAVMKLLSSMNIESQAYRTMKLPEDPPAIRLFPR